MKYIFEYGEYNVMFDGENEEEIEKDIYEQFVEQSEISITTGHRNIPFTIKSMSFVIKKRHGNGVFTIDKFVHNGSNVSGIWDMHIKCYDKTEYLSYHRMKIPKEGGFPTNMPAWIIVHNGLIKNKNVLDCFPEIFDTNIHTLMEIDNYVIDFYMERRSISIGYFLRLACTKSIQFDRLTMNYLLYRMLLLTKKLYDNNYVYTTIDEDNITMSFNNNDILIYFSNIQNVCMKNSNCNYLHTKAMDIQSIEKYRNNIASLYFDINTIPPRDYDEESKMIYSVIYTCFNLMNPVFYNDVCCDIFDKMKKDDVFKPDIRKMICECKEIIYSREQQINFYYAGNFGYLSKILAHPIKYDFIMNIFDQDKIKEMKTRTLLFIESLIAKTSFKQDSYRSYVPKCQPKQKPNF